jgi:thioesterase domain-containing protein
MTSTEPTNTTSQRPLEIPAEGPFDEESAEAAPVLGIHLDGPLPPLFLVRSWDELPQYRLLAAHLGPDQPAYFINPPRGETLDDYPSTMDAWSDLALERLLSIGYEGPYLLGGWSLGGVIALEAAEKLEARGHPVRLVAMLDTRLPKPHPKTLPGRRKTTKLFKLARNLNEYALFETRAQKNAYIRKRLRRRFQKISGKLRNQRNRLLGRQAPLQRHAIVDDQAIVTPGGRYMPLIKRTIYVVYLKYEKHESSIPVAQFWCRDSLYGAGGDASLGWAKYLRGDFEIVRLPATHFTMFDEPHVSFLAERLARSLKRARD